MPGKGHKGQGDPPVIGDRPLVKPLLPQLVEAPALRAAGPGADRPPQRQGLRPLVYVAQGQIVQAAGRHFLPPEGVVPALRPVQLPVEQADVDFSVRRGGEPRQQALRLLLPGKGGAVDHQPQLRRLRRRQGVLPEHMDVLRPGRRLPGTAGAVPVVVAGGDEHPGLHPAQGGGELLPRLPEGAGAVEQVPRQQHQADAPFIGVVRQTEQQLPALPAALRRPPVRQGAEGAVQVEVRGVEEADHACSSGRQPLHTSTHSTKLEAYRSSSSQVISTALLLLPAAGNTVSNRFRDTSR